MTQTATGPTYIERHIEGFGTVRSPAYWVPVMWEIWDDYNAMPDTIPVEIWQTHHGHHAGLRQSAFGTHGFRCVDCDTTWREPGT